MANLNESLKEAVCIDEEVFFGPITDKERKIREQFENLKKNELKEIESCKVVEDDESQSNSVYKSFSVDESKYDSFDDSLNEKVDKMPQEAKPITLRKSYDKIKSKRLGFYDSLEDVHSLVSNIDKCSISCDVENGSNLNSKHFVEDSLKNPLPVANKGNFMNEQVHFDDDSLAIIECEGTFSDSLEEVNVLESIDIEEIKDIDHITMESQNAFILDEQSSCPPKNLFDTSVAIVCEKKKDSSTAEQEESFDDKNLLYDSLSNSDFKDILTDSLEEGKQSKDILTLPKRSITNITHDNGNLMDNQNILCSVTQNSAFVLPKIFDTSVQIVAEKFKDNNLTKDSLNDKSILDDSLLNSELRDVLKDSLEESDKSNEILNVFQHCSKDDVAKSEDVYFKQNALETSVQIIYDNSVNHSEKESCDVKKTEDLTKKIENFESFQEIPSAPITVVSGNEQFSISKNICSSENALDDLKSKDDKKNALPTDSQVNGDKISPDISVDTNDKSNFKKETFSVDSCHLKLLNDNMSTDKDLKFQLHIEVTVGDQKCQISSQDIKIVPITSQSSKSEIDSISTRSIPYPLSSSISSMASNINVEKNEGVMHVDNTELSLQNTNLNVFRTHCPNEINSTSNRKPEAAFTANITQRAKSSASQTSILKSISMDSFNDVSLLQALDLPDLSASFLNESIIQSKDSLIPLNLYSPDECIQNFYTSQFKNKNKENIPEQMQVFDNQNFCAKRKSVSPNKVYDFKTPQSLKKCSSFKDTNKKTPGTKIPVRKVDNFAVPALTPKKIPKSGTLSAEKIKCQHSPHTIDSCKKTPGTTPNKIPHICKVRNTIFSKVPQIIPSKKYMNVQSPVAQYIKNNGPVKISGNDPVLRDCMNRLMESPHHLHNAPSSGSLKSSKKKA